MSAATKKRERIKPAARAAKAAKAASSQVINLRAGPDIYALIEAAREEIGESRTDFMLRSARIRAQQVLMNRTSFTLSSDEWQDLVAIMDNPPPANAALRAAFERTPPWDR